jgi:thiamine-phosphate pyrophosphorylase
LLALLLNILEIKEMIKNNFINTARSISFNRKRNKPFKKKNIRKLPNLWLFTDFTKTVNPVALSKNLPKNSGIVIRSYGAKNKETIIRDILNMKKRRLFTVLISGKYKRHLSADGFHVPQWINSKNKNKQIISMSVHSGKDVRKSINLKVDLIFISPVFKSTSHINNKNLGVVKLGLMAKLFKRPTIALGGINNKNINRLKNLPISGCAGIDIFINNRI